MRAPAAVALSFLACASAAPAAFAADARALDGTGRVLTVGNWTSVPTDTGFAMRVGDDRRLGWELRDAHSVIDQGEVPGAQSDGIDSSPVLSRDPVTGDIWVAWTRRVLSPSGVSLPSQVVLVPFSGQRFQEGALIVLGDGPSNHSSPALVHDDKGYLYAAWLDEGAGGAIRVACLAPSRELVGDRVLSQGISTRNSDPALGIDAFGQLLVAFRGSDLVTGVRRVFVLSPYDQGGGASHVPDPILELGLRVSVPESPSGTGPAAPPPAGVPTPLHLTVLGGTPIAWWTEGSDPGTQLVHYVAQAEDGWHVSETRTIDLGAGMAASLTDALEMLEARLRQVPGGYRTPTPPHLGVPSRPIRFR
jgi:hypothetical protein